MSALGRIRETAQQVAEAVSMALGVETEIVDDELTIVAGTGKYLRKIGMKEEEAYYDTGFLYKRVLSTGQAYVVEDPREDPTYDPSSLRGETDETAEICCPIILGERVIGVMGLVAFNDEQRNMMLTKRSSLMRFVDRMAFLLASKVSEADALAELTMASNRLKTIIETIHEGVIAVDEQGIITHCNATAERLFGKSKKDLIGTPLGTYWPDTCVLDALVSGTAYIEREEMHGTRGKSMHFFITARPIEIEGRTAGVVASFRDITEVKRLVYNMGEKKITSTFDEIKGESPVIKDLLAKAQKVAAGNSTVLITGESGTGKELLARALHSASPRSNGPFIAVNCGAIPETLLESELFGYEGGAFTGARREGKAGKFELADGGTIFLDEIGDLPLHLQVKLLHVLQTKRVERVGGNRPTEVDVRVIAATNRDLETMMKEGEFRSDLYFRLNVIPLHVPPLRDRKEDIPILLDYFLSKYSEMLKKPIKGFSDAARDLLCRYDWPGNVRELENAVEYAVNMESSDTITVDSVPPRLRKYALDPGPSECSLRKRLESYERSILQEYLERYGRSRQGKEKAAKALNISRATLYRKLSDLGIS
ncbi:MAG TPA: sigma 54-interacting transcriptional regulator [Clostridia bacterium]|nr:sigma 54-interacting transcriptional regulator [Clostridia bacterium]